MSDSLANNVRKGTIEVLELLADLAAQRAYERDVPIANVPAELVCMWFDDMYHPDTAAHAEAFSLAEQRALAEFHAFYDQHADGLPQEHGVAALHAMPIWIEITERASVALRELQS